MQPPSWVADYIGIPYLAGGRTRAGCDCWGLFALVLRERFQIDIADYDGPLFSGKRSVREVAEAARAFAARFRTIDRGAELEGDAVLLRSYGMPIHIGVVVAPGLMLHVEEGADAAWERYTRLEWRDRVIAFHRAEAP